MPFSAAVALARDGFMKDAKSLVTVLYAARFLFPEASPD